MGPEFAPTLSGIEKNATAMIIWATRSRRNPIIIITVIAPIKYGSSHFHVGNFI